MRNEENRDYMEKVVREYLDPGDGILSKHIEREMHEHLATVLEMIYKLREENIALNMRIEELEKRVI